MMSTERTSASPTDLVLAYVQCRAVLFLAAGPDERRGSESATWSNEQLESLRRGCEQILQGRGATGEVPLLDLDHQRCYDLIEVLHFELGSQSVVSTAGGRLLYRFGLRHWVANATLTLYGSVNLPPRRN